MARFDPGPVFSQVQAVTEFGFAGIVGYDFALGSRYGGRITWMSFFMKPDAQSLTAAMTGRTSAYDAVITVGGRIGIGR